MSERQVLETLERAQAWRALGRAFAPPRENGLLRDDLLAFRARTRGALGTSLDAALAGLESAAEEDLGAAYDRLFTGRGGVSARESAYADGRIVAPAELADVRGFLRAFGFEEKGELADHVATECELVSVLALKAAWALGRGWEERSRVASDAYEHFLADHLLRWIPRFAAGVRRAEAPSFYVAAGEALALFLADEASRLDLEPVAGGASAPAPAPPDELPCGNCQAATEAPGRS